MKRTTPPECQVPLGGLPKAAPPKGHVPKQHSDSIGWCGELVFVIVVGVFFFVVATVIMLTVRPELKDMSERVVGRISDNLFGDSSLETGELIKNMFVVLVLVFASAAVVSSTQNPPPGTIAKIAVVHTHGVRRPRQDKDEESSRALSDDGKVMLRQLGHALRARYPTAAIPKEYDSINTRSASASLLRCRESAVALLSAVFPAPLDFPLIEYVPASEDVVLQTTTWPANFMRGSDEALGMARDAAMRQFDAEALALFGCNAASKKNLAECVLAAQEEQMAAQYTRSSSNNVLSAYQRDTMAKLNAVRATFTHYTSAYPPYRSEVGFMAYGLMKDLLAKFSKAFSFVSYSIQPHMMVSVYAVLGLLAEDDVESPRNVPLFGEAFVVEVHTDGSVTGAIATPSLPTLNGSYNYVFAPVRLNSTMQAWVAYLATRAPPSTNPPCAVDRATLRARSCNSVNVPSPPGSPCEKFRAMCPMEACGVGSVYDRKDTGSMCVSLEVPRSVSISHTLFQYVVLLLSVVIVALVVHILKNRDRNMGDGSF